MKKRTLLRLSGILGLALILAAGYFFYTKPLYEDKSLKTEMDLLSTSGGILFYHDKYSVYPPTLELMFKTVGMDACEVNSIFPDQYTGKQTESREYTGKGGWMYNPEKKLLRLNYKSWLPPYKKYILRLDTSKSDIKGN